MLRQHAMRIDKHELASDAFEASVLHSPWAPRQGGQGWARDALNLAARGASATLGATLKLYEFSHYSYPLSQPTSTPHSLSHDNMHASSSKMVLRTIARPSRPSNLQARSSRPITTLTRYRPTPTPPSLRATRTFFSLADISKLANLASSANEEESAIESDGEVQKFHAKKVLP